MEENVRFRGYVVFFQCEQAFTGVVALSYENVVKQYDQQGQRNRIRTLCFPCTSISIHRVDLLYIVLETCISQE